MTNGNSQTDLQFDNKNNHKMDYFITGPDKKLTWQEVQKQYKYCTVNTLMYFQAFGTSKTHFLCKSKKAQDHTKYHLGTWHMHYRNNLKRIRKTTTATINCA